jgi:colanic acid biosynthesis protein WcaH
MFLDNSIFTKVVESTPLVSIDLVIQNSAGNYLLGLRNNKPAKNCWFVPGGRILKNETLNSAFQRLCKQELAIQFERNQALFLGNFEHFYNDSVFGDNISTHYVVMGYKIVIDIDLATLPQDQHKQYKWFSKNQMLTDSSVHQHTRWYVE